jgi:chloramphenicol 3-O phosphotransferase
VRVDPPFVIVLNGISSSGKTTLADALRDQLPQPWFRLGVDDILRLSAALVRPELYPSMESATSLLQGAHRAFAAIARAGNLAVLDVVLMTPFLAEDLNEALGDLPMLVVGLDCAVEIAEERQVQRGREAGEATAQAATVFSYVTPDIVLDTGRLTTEECVAAVAEAVAAGRQRVGLMGASSRG